MTINYILKIVKITVVILNFAYLLGMFWYIMVFLIADLYEEDHM
jgi:uncharacterized PurR-regulated membrane protein YhhQ (DUF165 family)